MKSINFIISKIEMLIEKFPSIQIKYEFEENEDTHNIEISPLSFFECNEDFKKIEKDIYLEFFKLFPFEGLYFIDENSLYPITNPTIIKKGVEYRSLHEFNIQTSFNTFETPIPIISSTNNPNLINSNINVHTLNTRNSITSTNLETELMYSLMTTDLIEKSDNASFALAA
jgi:hypothetical protein